MLVQFSVENFASFKEVNTLSMLASKRKSQSKQLDEESVFSPIDSYSLLKTAAIYGANGSGKSNLAAALSFVKKLVLDSSKESQAGERIGVTPYRLSQENDGKPSSFSIVFIKNKIIFQYEFSADETAIRTESLTMRSSRAKKDIVLFTRIDDVIKPTKKFPEGDGLERKTRRNSLFLSVCANFDGEISTTVINWFRSLRVINGLNDTALYNFTFSRLQDPAWNKKISALVAKFDLGIEKLVPAKEEDTAEGDDENEKLLEKNERKFFVSPPVLSSFHNRFNADGEVIDAVPFNFKKDESQGTQKLISMAGPLIATLEEPLILVIDEFDARLHSIMSKNILKIFNSEINSNNAQLIVMTHDTNLLDKELLRRDQVWFVEKDIFGASHMHSLVEYRIRNDASYEKDYMSGKYGAIPLIGDVKRIIETPRRKQSTKSNTV